MTDVTEFVDERGNIPLAKANTSLANKRAIGGSTTETGKFERSSDFEVVQRLPQTCPASEPESLCVSQHTARPRN